MSIRFPNVETAPGAASAVSAATPIGRGTSARFARFGATPMKTPGMRSSQWRMEGHPARAIARLLGEDGIGSAVWSFLVPSARPAKLDGEFRFVRSYSVEIESADGSSTLYSGDYYRHSRGSTGAVEERWCELQPRKQVVKSDPHTRDTRRTLRKIRSTAKKKQLDAAPDEIAVRAAVAAAKDAEKAATEARKAAKAAEKAAKRRARQQLQQETDAAKVVTKAAKDLAVCASDAAKHAGRAAKAAANAATSAKRASTKAREDRDAACAKGCAAARAAQRAAHIFAHNARGAAHTAARERMWGLITSAQCAAQIA